MTKNIRWVIAHEPIDLFLRAAERFSAEVTAKTNGAISIEVMSLSTYAEKYNDGKKVTKHDLLDLMEAGEIEMSQMYTTWLGEFNEDMFVLDMPFLFRDHEHAASVLDGEIGQYLMKGLADKSAVRGLAFTYSGGYRCIPADQAIATVEALKGMKVRTARSPVAIDTFLAVGAEPVHTVELEEMNEAAEAGIINAGESTFVRVLPLEQDKAFEFVNDTAHSLFLTSIIVSRDFWKTLDVATQETLQSAALSSALIERKESVVDVAAVKETLGNRVVEMSAEEQDKFKVATESVYSKYQNYFTTDLVGQIQAK
jgi:TRAP-type C4-dicarboxylate transport system substrate-binding protein